MIPFIYIEEDARNHPRVKAILKRHPRATLIKCNHYSEVFNPKAQNYRLQKQRPALILARKHKNFVQQAPAHYGIGGDRNYYFSHLLNCLYDCRYCFIQGMYRSAHYVLFVNYEDFFDEMDRTRHPDKQSWFFSGYDSDSLALEPVTGFVKTLLPWLEQRSDVIIELRSKSTQIQQLLKSQPLDNLIVAFSFSPEKIWATTEQRVPSIEKRLEAMEQLAHKGWRLGLRFDPMIWHKDWQHNYKKLFKQLFTTLNTDSLHSVTFGPFRIPQQFFNTIVHLYPEEPLFAAGVAQRGKIMSYSKDVENEMIDFATNELGHYINPNKLFPNLPEA